MKGRILQSGRLILSIALTSLFCSVCVINCDVTHHQRITQFEQTSRECSDRYCGKKSGVVTSVRGAIDCARRCGNSENCQGFSVEEDKKCYLYDDCSSLTDCSSVAWQPPSTFYLRVGKQRCENGGVWREHAESCRCINGWAGTFCHRPVSSCLDLPKYGYEDGHQILDITLPGTGRVLSVYCATSPIQVMTMVLRTAGTNSFADLSWQDYVRGRSNGFNDYWVGLDTLHELTQAGYNKLIFEVTYRFSYYARHEKTYTGFHVGDSSTDYTLTISGSEPVDGGAFTDLYGDMLGDCLGPLNGTKFSAPDNDNDLDLDNCAAKAKRGWWFKDCNFSCNPLGILGGTGDDTLLLPGLNFQNSTYPERFRMLNLYFWQGV